MKLEKMIFDNNGGNDFKGKLSTIICDYVMSGDEMEYDLKSILEESKGFKDDSFEMKLVNLVIGGVEVIYGELKVWVLEEMLVKEEEEEFPLW